MTFERLGVVTLNQQLFEEHLASIRDVGIRPNPLEESIFLLEGNAHRALQRIEGL